MKGIKYISFLLFFIFGLFAARAQQKEDCAIVLKNALKTYDEGAIEKVVDMLQGCMENGFSKEEKVQAYRLLILTYLFENNRTEAERNMVKLLKMEPEYQVNSAVDPPEFIKLFESYRTMPVFSMGLALGINFSVVSVLKNYSIDIVDPKTKIKYHSKVGFQVALNYNHYLFDRCELSVEASLGTNTFQYQNDLIDFANVTFKETQSWIKLPVSATYDFGKGKKFKPYARLGASVGYLFSDNANIVRTYPLEDNSSSSAGKHAPVTSPTISLKKYKYTDQFGSTQTTNLRNTFNYWILVGGGIKYKIKRGFVVLDVRYNLGLLNQVNTANRYSGISDLVFKYYYIDSDFKMSDLAVSLKYVRSFYKPKKKKEIN